MPRKPQSKRVPAEDSDTESEYDTQAANHARDEALRRLQEMDLGTYRAGRLKQDDRKQKYEDRANVKLLLDTREACQAGTEAHTLYNKNKSATAAWNNPNNVVDNHEEQFDTLDGGNAHRQRMRNEHGGRVEEPDDWETGYAKGGRGRSRGGFASRGGRGGVAAPAAPRAPAPTGPRAGIAPRLGPCTSRPAPTQPANYRPLDPAIDPDNDSRSKYAKAPIRGGAPVGRGGGHAGRGSGPAEFNARVAPTPAPARARVSRPGDADGQNRIDMLADPAAFMQAVDAMKATSTKTKTETTTAVKTTPKASSTTIVSKWANVGSAKSAAVPKPSTNISLSPATAAANASIRQVPTSEFALPHPHRGDTESWTDGVLSAHPSDFNSPAISSESSDSTRPSHAIALGNTVGLGIQGVDTSLEDDETTDKGNTAHSIDLVDVTEDLRELQEPPEPRTALAKRIVVNGALYILDESALGNASSAEVISSLPAPPPQATPPQCEWTSPTDNTIKRMKPKKATSTTGSSSTMGNRNVAAQTTPSLTKSRWADTAPSCVVNPFATGTAPARANQAQVQSPGEFIAFVGRRPEEGVSAFLNSELTSPGGVESVISTPNLASSRWGRTDAQVATNSSTQVQSSSTPTATPVFAPPHIQAILDRDITMADAAVNASRASQPAIIDNYDLVRLQAVGNASFGMTPFRPTPGPSLESNPNASARPTPSRQQSTTTRVNSDGTSSSARARGLTASKYASGDAASNSITHLGLDALQSLSLNSSVPPRGGNTVPKPPPSRAVFGTASNASRYGTQDENTHPRHANSTSNSGGRPILRPISRVPPASANSGPRVRMQDGREYRPISRTRRPAGEGFAVMQADIAGSTTAPTQSAGILISTTSTAPTVLDDGYESEL